MRVCVCGGPRVGKTTYAGRLSFENKWPIRHTDDLIGKMDWSAASEEVAHWLTAPGPWVLEGVALVRALRKFLKASDGLPCDKVIWMPSPKVELSAGQLSMMKGCQTIWSEVYPDLLRRGVPVESL